MPVTITNLITTPLVRPVGRSSLPHCQAGPLYYSKRHNKFLFPALAGAIYGSFCKAENEISNVVNYRSLPGI